MSSKLSKRIFGILVVSTIFFAGLRAQTRNDVVAAFNEGAKAAPTNAAAGIAAFEKAITLAGQVGTEADDLKEKASKALPGLYTKVAVATINEKKTAPEIMKASKAAAAIAEKYGTPAQKENASKLIVQAYNIQATTYFGQNDFNNALVTFDSLLAINPGFVNAIYNKALIYIKQNNPDAYEQTIDLYIEKLKGVNDTTKIKQASTQALEYFRAVGSKANQAEKLDDALTLLTKAAKYGNDKDLFYYFADVYNKKKNFDNGADYAKRGLDLETGTAEAKAKFWFQLGLAQAGKGQTADACASFKNSLYGPFAEPSKVQRKNLKCE
jgi:tetratricopeptide (TPR) repeat protein